MLITKNGQIKAVPSASMMLDGNQWKNLLVCKCDKNQTAEKLKTLFQTDTVTDDITGAKWLYTKFVKVAEDETFRYVWLEYSAMDLENSQYKEALNILGVDTNE